jgi:hypothetical protein
MTMRMRLKTFNVAHPHLRNRDGNLSVVLRASGEALSSPVASPSNCGDEGSDTEVGCCGNS